MYYYKSSSGFHLICKYMYDWNVCYDMNATFIHNLTNNKKMKFPLLAWEFISGKFPYMQEYLTSITETKIFIWDL